MTDLPEYIRPVPEHPRYWLVRGEPTVLLGGSWQDNLFNHPTNLEEHLDRLVEVGGNYVRNVMSHRNEGNVYPYVRTEDGFDLDRFNPEYWDRFERFLDLTAERDIVVQLEVWATWDLYEDHQSRGGWSFHPYNPANNISYSPESSGLPTSVTYPPSSDPTEHPFFRTVPEIEHNELVLGYQRAFVDALLDRSLSYPNVLYCMNNETGERLEWGDYWLSHVRNRAAEEGTEIHTTDMRRNEDVTGSDHNHIYDRPDRYTFVDISQNNAWEGEGQNHYENIRYVHERTADHPRPINNVKNYGANRYGEEESVARFCRIVFGGCASARFHRPHPKEDPDAHEEASDVGLGLSPRAQGIIESMRMIADDIVIPRCTPRPDLLGDREPNEAYLLADPGTAYAVYLPNGGSVSLDCAHGEYTRQWLDIDASAWGDPEHVQPAETLSLRAPGEGHWAATVLAIEGTDGS